MVEAKLDEAPGPDFQALFEATPGLYLVLDCNFVIVAVNEAYLRATMTQREQIIGRGIFDVFPDNPDDPSATGVSNLRSSLQRVLRSRKPDTMAVQKYDVRRPAAEGGGFEERHWSPVNSPVIDGHGKVVWIIHRVEDVTEFVRLRQQRREHQREAADLRQQTERMETEIINRSQELQLSNQALRQSEEELRRLNETLEQRILERTQQLEAETLERERAQEALLERQKLESIGRLAGGVAHDFNNLLTVIQGSTDLLYAAATTDALQKPVKWIDIAAERGARLTRQLLAFSRHQALHPELVDLRARTDDISELLTRSLRGDIRVVVTIAEDAWPIECDVGELELALLNLCVNSRDAMPDGGLIRIDGRNVTLSGAEGLPGDLSGDHVAITVTDTGTGIAPASLARVFEPFFTTKPVGEGTGLGLSQVHGFATQAGGTAAIESDLGNGTVVTLYLPRAAAPAIAADAARRTTTSRGTGQILLVEDDDAVAATAEQLLSLIGYKPQRVVDARTALSVLLGGHAFDLVFTDIVMPGGMSGLDLAHRIRRHFPDLPVLLASGYSHATADVAREGFAIIAKPYRADALADAIRRTITLSQQRKLDSA
ncbi:MAG TPA: ATP-binding protein [Verrucomicrobiae bacterium]|nr:ATP-binding protein [Verrucomicrobiae bacterium]